MKPDRLRFEYHSERDEVDIYAITEDDGYTTVDPWNFSELQDNLDANSIERIMEEIGQRDKGDKWETDAEQYSFKRTNRTDVLAL